MNVEKFVNELSKLRQSSTFLTLKGYRNNCSEIADYSLCFHISYKSALERSIDKLDKLNLITDLEKQAKEELLVDFQKSLSKMEEEPVEEREDGYTHFTDDKGVYVKGLRLHNASGTLQIFGLVVHKNVRLPGNYAKKNKAALTQAKDKLRYLTPCGKFRSFKITADRVDVIRVESLSLLPPNVED